jgi:hypothetical protein
MTVTEKQIMGELTGLDPTRWDEVLDFIAFLKHRVRPGTMPSRSRQLTARKLLKSEIVGMWADRQDIGNSLTFARQLRYQAEHCRSISDDSA